MNEVLQKGHEADMRSICLGSGFKENSSNLIYSIYLARKSEIYYKYTLKEFADFICNIK